jgi:hypothetical protein
MRTRTVQVNEVDLQAECLCLPKRELLFQTVQRALQCLATLFLCRRQTRLRQWAFFQRVLPIVVEHAIVVQLVLLILRVAGGFEIPPARIVVAENPFAWLAFLSVQLRREAASVNRDAGGRPYSGCLPWRFGSPQRAAYCRRFSH